MHLRSRTLPRAGAALLAAVALSSAASAQTGEAADSAEDILVIAPPALGLTLPSATGSRLGLSPLELPATVSTVDGDAIRARGDLTVVDAVTRAPGITSSANPGNGGTSLVVRGFSGQGSVLQLVDGVRLFPVAGTITFPSDPWNVERIEVLSGPASVLYGQGALGGAVNIVTKAPDPTRSRLDLEAAYGSQNTVLLAAGAGGPAGETLSYRVDASYRRSDGWVDRGGSHSIALSGAVRFAPTESFALTLRDDFGDNRPMEYFGTPLIDGRLDGRNRHRNYNVRDGELKYRDNRLTLKAEWTPSDAVAIVNDAYRLTSKRLFRNLESYFWQPEGGPSGSIFRTDNLGIVHDQTQYGDQGSVKLSTPFGGTVRNDLVVGFDVNLIKLTYLHNFGSDTQEAVVDPFVFEPGLLLDTQGIAPRYRTRTLEYSVFAEDRLRLNDRLSIVGGVRAEWDEISRYTFVYDANGNRSEVPALNAGRSASKKLDNVTGRVGVVYQPTATLSFYGQYATGVDPLGTLTTFSTNDTQFLTSNATGNQIEGGIKATFLDGRGSATLAAYRIVKNNLVAQRRPNGTVDQIGQRSSKGIEATLAFTLPNGFGIDANGTILDAEYDDFVSGDDNFAGNTPPGVPETAANIWLTWQGLGGFRAQAGMRYVGRRFSDDANTYRVPGYVVVDGGLSYAFTANVAVDIRVQNLFDRHYATTTYNDEQWLLGRPRSVDVALRARF